MGAETGIVDYYNQTHLGYRLFWGLNRAFSMHYGLHDAQHRSHVDAVRNLIRFLSSAAEITAEDEVLDVGCGFGGSSIWLAQNVGCRVTGIDINPREIESARRQAKKSGVDHLVRFIEMDYREMGRLEAAAFSVLWQIETLTAPTGGIHRRRAPRAPRRWPHRHRRLLLAPGKDGPDRPADPRPVGSGLGRDPSGHARRVRRLLAEAGFEKVRFRDESAGVLPPRAG